VKRKQDFFSPPLVISKGNGLHQVSSALPVILKKKKEGGRGKKNK